MNVPDILEKIIDVKKDEVAAIKRNDGMARYRDEAQGAPVICPFLPALHAKAADPALRAALIAEVKKASPSKGLIRADFDPAAIGEQYAEGGAACLSVLTDIHFFQGAPEYLAAARQASGLPVLRKDFTIDPVQLYEARAMGADAILLIAACLDPYQLADLSLEAQEALSLGVLVEVHSEEEWEAVAAASPGPALVGVNNRNLHDFTVDLKTTERLAPAILAAGSFLVAESGLFTPDDVDRVRNAGAQAILVGESLMRERDVTDAVRRLIER